MEKSQDLSLDITPSASNTSYLVFSLFFLGAILRYSYYIWGPTIEDNIWSDMSGYAHISDEILADRWNVNHFFQSIGYPLLLALTKSLATQWGAIFGFIQTTFSLLTIYFVYQTTLMSLGKKPALITLALAAIHVPFILFNVLALPESIFTFLLSVSAYQMASALQKNKNSHMHLFLWALSFMAGFWLKGTHVLWAPLFLLLYFWYRKYSFKSCIVPILIMILSLSAHGWLTKTKIDKIQLSASTGGLNFIEGKCPLKNNRDSAGYAWLSPLYYQLDLHQQKYWPRPFTDSGYFMKEGLKCIQDRPSVLIQSLESIPFLFIGNTLWPFNQFPFAALLRLYEQIYAIFSITGLIFFGFYLLRNRDIKKVFIWVLPIGALFLCVYIFKSEIRYRIPFDIWIIPMSVRGWMDFLSLQRGEHAPFSRRSLSE